MAREWMQAVVVTEFGSPDVLRPRTVAIPQPGQGEVLVKVAYAGVNFSEIYARRGQARVFSLPFVPGLEVTGEVVQAGPRVRSLKVGDLVAALSRVGGYAEYVAVPEERTYALEPDTDLLTAIAFPTSLSTAWLILRLASGNICDRTVLVHAAAGALGTALASVAAHHDVGRLLGTVSTTEKATYAKAQGYDSVYLRNSWADELTAELGAAPVDVAVESIGGEIVAQTLEVLCPLGRLIVCGNASDADDTKLSREHLWFTNRAVCGFNIGGLTAQAPTAYRQEAAAALEAFKGGVIGMPVHPVGVLADAPSAHAALEQGATKGKMALEVCPS